VLRRPPLISVTNIKYYDEDDSLQTWAASNYEVDAPGSRVLLADTGTLPNVYSRYDAVQITYQAGYASTTSPVDYQAPIPEIFKVAIKLLIGDYYENREGKMIIPAHLSATENPTVDRILWSQRVRV